MCQRLPNLPGMEPPRPSLAVAAGRGRPLLTAACRAWPAGVAVAAATLVAMVVAPGPTAVAAAHVLLPGVAVLAAASCALRAVLVARERLAWSALAGGMASLAVAYLYWQLAVHDVGVQPAPTLADAGWLAFYPPAYAGIGLLVRARVVHFAPSLWLDGIITGLAAAAVTAAVAFRPVAGIANASWQAVVVCLAYPVADVVLVALLAGALAIIGGHANRSWSLVIAGLATLAVADSLYLHAFANGSYAPHTPQDALWPLGLALLAGAAWQHEPPRSPVPLDSWRVLAVPAISAAAAVLALVVDHYEPLDGVAIWLAAATILLVIGRAVVAFRELRALADSRRLALTDELTGLANRRAFLGALRDGVRTAEAAGRRMAVLLVDLDRFKEINDTLGHHTGDLVLAELGRRLRRALPRAVVLARLGGDEFAVVVDLAPGTPDPATLAATIRAEAGRPCDAGGFTVDVDASVGIAVFPDHAGDPDALLQRADVAMYQAKQARTGHAVYSPDRDPHTRERLALVHDLRSGIAAGQLELHYQPTVRVATGEVCGVEALVRWRHPERGVLAPGAFLPLAEQAGLTRAIARAVLGDAVAQAAAWRARGLELPVTVNLAGADVADPALAHEIRFLLGEHGVPGQALAVDVTEAAAMADDEASAGVLRDLRGLGLAVALDDFGTGRSSLGRLTELPVDELKIDRAFVARAVSDAGAGALVRSIVELARTLGLRVVAEGVEDEQTWELLRRLGCHAAQGYWIGPPMPAGAFAAWCDRRAAERPPAVGVATAASTGSRA